MCLELFLSDYMMITLGKDNLYYNSKSTRLEVVPITRPLFTAAVEGSANIKSSALQVVSFLGRKLFQAPAFSGSPVSTRFNTRPRLVTLDDNEGESSAQSIRNLDSDHDKYRHQCPLIDASDVLDTKGL